MSSSKIYIGNLARCVRACACVLPLLHPPRICEPPPPNLIPTPIAHSETTEQDLVGFFGGLGWIQRIGECVRAWQELVRLDCPVCRSPPLTHTPTDLRSHFAFITFEDEQSAEEAVLSKHGK